MSLKNLQTIHDEVIHDIQYNFNGTRLATCSSDKRIAVWDLDESTDGWVINDFWKAHNGSVLSIAWCHPEFGNIIASSSWDRTVKIWVEQENNRKNSGQRWICAAKLIDSPAAVHNVCFSPVFLGLKLAAASSDGQVRVYSPEEAPNMQNWRVSAQLDAADGITLKDSDGPLCISWCEERLQPATMMLVGCNRIRQVRVFRYIRNNWVHYFDVAKYRSDILCMSWAPQMGRSFHLIATGCADGIVRIYRINTSSSIDPVKFDLDSLFDQSTNSIEPPIPKVFDSNDVSVLQLTSKDATPADKTRALDVQTQEPMTIVDGTTKAAALEVNSVSGVPIGVALDEQPPDTTQNSLFKPQENIKIQLLAELNGHNRLPIRKLKWNIVGSVLVSCGDDGSTVLWSKTNSGTWANVAAISS